MEDRFAKKLEHVQGSIEDIQTTAEKKNDVIASLQDEKKELEMQLAASRAKMPHLEAEIRKLEESNFDFKDRSVQLTLSLFRRTCLRFKDRCLEGFVLTI